MDARTPHNNAEQGSSSVSTSYSLAYSQLKDGRWTFQYADEFRQQKEIRRLPIFPELDTVYKSEELWQFFRMRVPRSEATIDS